MSDVVCQICKSNPSKYKCPTCSIRYCSLACYKNEELHIHSEKEPESKEVGTGISQSNEDKVSTKLKSEKFDKIYQNSADLQDLLQYNTVKFHLNKVYKILTTETDASLNSESRKQLAIDYLNTLRYGGGQYNEAIEDFCTITLGKLNEA